ncbi:hypothetical protein GCM10010527_09440 [Streptomyces drozdowiczii]
MLRLVVAAVRVPGGPQHLDDGRVAQGALEGEEFGGGHTGSGGGLTGRRGPPSIRAGLLSAVLAAHGALFLPEV